MATSPKIVQVSWIDAVADVGWEAKTKAEIHHCITVGYLVDETDEALCLASTWSIDQTNARMHIPKAWIKNRDRKSTRLNSSHIPLSRMPSSA